MTRRIQKDPEAAHRKSADRATRTLAEAFDRLGFAARVQEIVGLPKPPRFRTLDARARASRWILEVTDRRWGLGRFGVEERKRRLGYLFAVVGLRLVAGQWRKGGGLREAFRVADTRVRDHDARLRPPAGYVDVTDREESVVRAALMLRLLKRPAAALALLLRRFRSTRPSAETRAWLAFLLREGGEGKVAPLVAPEPTAEPVVAPKPRRSDAALKFGVVMTTMLETPVFLRSLRSLIESDYRGEVVVVEDGGDSREACREACDSMSVRYLKTATWVGSAAAINAGIELLGPDIDVVIFSHNDVLWPPHWFRHVERAWEIVFDTQRVSVLNLGYVQLKRRTDPALYELFLRGRYHDLLWLLRSMREVPGLMEQIQDAQVKPGEQPFGLARDPWVDSVPALRFQSGRFSVAASFPRLFWSEMGGFDADLVYAFDLQLLQRSVEERRWALFVNNPPLIHLKSTDTRTVSADRQAVIGRMLQQTYESFQRKYGWQIEHYLNLFFSETMVLHQDAVLTAVNAGRFADVDHVFDDFLQRLTTRRLANCELTWCRTRANCPYV